MSGSETVDCLVRLLRHRQLCSNKSRRNYQNFVSGCSGKDKKVISRGPPSNFNLIKNETIEIKVLRFIKYSEIDIKGQDTPYLAFFHFFVFIPLHLHRFIVYVHRQHFYCVKMFPDKWYVCYIHRWTVMDFLYLFSHNKSCYFLRSFLLE